MIKKSILTVALLAGATNIVHASYCDYTDYTYGLSTTHSPPPEERFPIHYRAPDMSLENCEIPAEEKERLELISEIMVAEYKSSDHQLVGINLDTRLRFRRLSERLSDMSIPELVQLKIQMEMDHKAKEQAEEVPKGVYQINALPPLSLDEISEPEMGILRLCPTPMMSLNLKQRVAAFEAEMAQMMAESRDNANIVADIQLINELRPMPPKNAEEGNQ